MQNIRENAYRVVKTVASPLRFFAVIVGVLGAIIVALGWKSTLPADVTMYIIVVAFVVLLVVIGIVLLLVIIAPKKLVFDQEAHLAVMREQLGDSELPHPYSTGTLPKVSATRQLPEEPDRS